MDTRSTLVDTRSTLVDTRSTLVDTRSTLVASIPESEARISDGRTAPVVGTIEESVEVSSALDRNIGKTPEDVVMKNKSPDVAIPSGTDVSGTLPVEANKVSDGVAVIAANELCGEAIWSATVELPASMAEVVERVNEPEDSDRTGDKDVTSSCINDGVGNGCRSTVVVWSIVNMTSVATSSSSEVKMEEEAMIFTTDTDTRTEVSGISDGALEATVMDGDRIPVMKPADVADVRMGLLSPKTTSVENSEKDGVSPAVSSDRSSVRRSSSSIDVSARTMGMEGEGERTKEGEMRTVVRTRA